MILKGDNENVNLTFTEVELLRMQSSFSDVMFTYDKGTIEYKRAQENKILIDQKIDSYVSQSQTNL